MLTECQYEESMKVFETHLTALTQQIQEIAEKFADGAWESRPLPYSNPVLQKQQERLFKQSQDALNAMIELHERFNAPSP